jgi:hypothetical protein
MTDQYLSEKGNLDKTVTKTMVNSLDPPLGDFLS